MGDDEGKVLAVVTDSVWLLASRKKGELSQEMMTSSMAIVATTRFNSGLKNLGLGEGKPSGWSSSLALENRVAIMRNWDCNVAIVGQQRGRYES